MTPGARVAAAIAVLDQINQGSAAEAALTNWARASRYAGAKDRAAVRDYVYDVLRARRSLGDGTGRALMLRLLLRDGAEIDQYFNGLGHAPAPVSADEHQAAAQDARQSEAASVDMPDWLWPQWSASLGAAAMPVARAQQARANVFLRVNQSRADQAQAQAVLADDAIISQPHPHITGCLQVTDNARRIKTSAAYLTGLVDLQDAASQRAVGLVPVPDGGRLLDYCAGGGGKALAFADQHDAQIFAHDIAFDRMRDIPVRAARAGLDIALLEQSQIASSAPFDVVFCDAPCSGSGTWRRTPDAKWRLTSDRLADLTTLQDQVIASAAPLVVKGGLLAYATCSVLHCENDAVVDRFVAADAGWQVILRDQALPDPEGDGFYLALLRQIDTP
jgi:16S rRNA (cytosine967-C5)-methyltransferase